MRKILERLKNLDSKEKYFLLMGLAGTAFLWMLFYFVLHCPLQRAAMECRQESVQAAGEITVVTNFQNAHLQFKEYQGELAKREKRARHALPDKMAQGEFLSALDRLAVNSGIRIIAVSPGKITVSEESLCLPIRVHLAGGYFSLLRFMQGLQEGDRLVVINRMSVKQSKEKEADLTVELGLKIFAVPDE